MYVPDQTAAIKRFSIRRTTIQRALIALSVAAAAFLIMSIDYVIARIELSELDDLRAETVDQRNEIQDYVDRVDRIKERLAKINGMERKLRVITNLDPADPRPLPGIGGTDGELLGTEDLAWLSRTKRHQQLKDSLDHLTQAAGVQEESLSNLIIHLEGQTARLLHTPSITPTTGWITSSYGYRSSPFTSNREFHRGLDIAGRQGTPILAPADGKVRFAGQKRALGNAVRLQHGYGIETIYGHLSELLVKPGEKVKRGQKIALMGTTGRSTGPHLHYQVMLNSKPVNPRNYMLD
ncbi:MAG: M23 family metallopeptidase [bacterium]|nr:M23 family metallopeptidase [bacterium]